MSVGFVVKPAMRGLPYIASMVALSAPSAKILTFSRKGLLPSFSQYILKRV